MSFKKKTALIGVSFSISIISFMLSFAGFLNCTQFYGTSETWRFYASLVSVLIFGSFLLLSTVVLFVVLFVALLKSRFLN
jgi:hypothetical protein